MTRGHDPDTAAPERRRLDKWLWFARFAKSRALAARLVADGYVRINGRRVENGAKGVVPGDVLTIAVAHGTMLVRVRALGERRGPAVEARTLYEPVGAETGAETGAPPDP